jgi:nitrate/nitrite-specific signal transduction histidine kinase
VSERDVAALDAVVSISRALSSGTDLDSILELVAKRGRALVSARAVAVEVEDVGRTVVAAIAGHLPEGLNAARKSAESTLLAVPLALHGRAYGALIAVDRRGGGARFSVEDEELLEALAPLAAGAVAAEKFGEPRRPVVLDHVGLAAAIELVADLVESPKREIRTRIDLSYEEGRLEARLDGEVETVAYRIVQEALTSIVKCPAASQVLLEVIEDDAREELRIEVRSFGPDSTRMTATLPARRRHSMLSID